MGFCSVWDLQKELVNMANGDKLRPQNPEKDSRWLSQRLDQLPLELESQVRARAFRLTHPEYRAIWQEMADQYLEVILLLRSAVDDSRRFNCLFNHAMRKMASFLGRFATKAAPFSGSASDPQFEILMENFGTVFDIISIFYDCFNCESRMEGLLVERNAKRMHFFRFDKNDPGPLLDIETMWKLYGERFPGGFPRGDAEAHKFYPPDDTPKPTPMEATAADAAYFGLSSGSQRSAFPRFPQSQPEGLANSYSWYLNRPDDHWPDFEM